MLAGEFRIHEQKRMIVKDYLDEPSAIFRHKEQSHPSVGHLSGLPAVVCNCLDATRAGGRRLRLLGIAAGAKRRRALHCVRHRADPSQEASSHAGSPAPPGVLALAPLIGAALDCRAHRLMSGTSRLLLWSLAPLPQAVHGRCSAVPDPALDRMLLLGFPVRRIYVE